MEQHCGHIFAVPNQTKPEEAMIDALLLLMPAVCLAKYTQPIIHAVFGSHPVILLNQGKIAFSLCASYNLI